MAIRSCCSSSISSSSSSKAESESDWEGLHKHVSRHFLDSILDKLATNLSDYIRFGVVCKAWNSCILNHYTRKHITLTNHHLPFLLLCLRSPSHGPYDVKNLCLYNLSTGKFCKSKLHIKPFRKFDDKTFCGSSHGWLFFMENSVPRLSNPFSGAFFNLPALDVSRSTDHCNTFILSRDPSLGSFEVLASSCCDNVLAHYKSGDEDWTYLEHWKSYPCNDFDSFIFTKHHILAVSADRDDCNNLILHITSRDFDPSKMSINEIPRAPKELSGDESCVSSYFVETTNGDLLMVLRHYEWDLDGDSDGMTSKAYRLYKLIGLGLEEQVELVQIEDLEGDCLFLGDNQSISVLASNYPGLMPNTIYCSSYGEADRKIEVFNLKDGIVTSICLPEKYFEPYGTSLMVPSIKL